MKFTLQDAKIPARLQSAIIIPINMSGELTTSGQTLNDRCNGLFKQIQKSGQFPGKVGQTLLLPEMVSPLKQPILLVGTGKSLELSFKDFKKLLMTSIRCFYDTKVERVLSTLTELKVEKQTPSWIVKQAVEITSDALYRFDIYKSEMVVPHAIKEITFSVSDKKRVNTCKEVFHQALAIAEGVSYTKNLANLPSNVCTPSYLAEQAKLIGKDFKSCKVKIVDESEMQKLGMNAFLAVTKGSAEAAKLICVEYTGGPKKSAPICLVGKGITFDTGGLSLKPADAMVGMKYDMCGAATVLGTIRTAATLKLPINIVGFVAAAENMPSGTATKPEDIVKTLSGQTVEIMNTDAEGRLVLCDTITYCERYKPKAVIDIATLTGAVVIALGYHASGLLSNNETLAQELIAAGTESHDRAWQLPLWDDYQEQLKSPFADMSNVGGRVAGTITAACFLSRFAKKFPWAHLDVAGTAAMMSGNDRFATGRPVPLLMQYLINESNK